MVGASSFLSSNGSLVASNAETGGWRAGDASHAAGEEITVDQLKPKYLHCRPKAGAGEASAARRRLFLYA
jgi:hypothetical protein